MKTGKEGRAVKDEEVQTTRYKIRCRDILSNTDSSKYFIITINGV